MNKKKNSNIILFSVLLIFFILCVVFLFNYRADKKENLSELDSYIMNATDTMSAYDADYKEAKSYIQDNVIGPYFEILNFENVGDTYFFKKESNKSLGFVKVENFKVETKLAEVEEAPIISNEVSYIVVFDATRPTLAFSIGRNINSSKGYIPYEVQKKRLQTISDYYNYLASDENERLKLLASLKNSVSNSLLDLKNSYLGNDSYNFTEVYFSEKEVLAKTSDGWQLYIFNSDILDSVVNL